MTISKLKIIFILALIFLALPLNAQIDLPAGFPTSADYLKIHLNPENPKPNSSVTASLEFYLTDLKKSEISWFLNGELQTKSIGLTSLRFTLSAAGERQVLEVSLLTFEGERIDKEIVITSGEVDLIINANTYTPPFYKGRSLLTGKGGNLTVTALPNIIDSNGEKVDASNLSYRWYKDNTFLEGQSGYGKSSIKIGEASFQRPFQVRVIAETIDSQVSSEEVVGIDYLEPKVLIYQVHPLYGALFNEALTNITLEEGELILSAVPYFFSETFKNSGFLRYLWQQNGVKLDENFNQSKITVRQTDENQIGEASIEVSVQNRDDFTQVGSSRVGVTVK